MLKCFRIQLYITINHIQIFNTIEFGNNLVGFGKYNCDYSGIDAINNNINTSYTGDNIYLTATILS